MKFKRVPTHRRLSRRVLWDAACNVSEFGVRYGGHSQTNAYSCYRVRDASAISDAYPSHGDKAMRDYIKLAAWAGCPLDPINPGELQELAHWMRNNGSGSMTDLYERTNALRFDFLHLLSLSYEK